MDDREVADRINTERTPAHPTLITERAIRNRGNDRVGGVRGELMSPNPENTAGAPRPMLSIARDWDQSPGPVAGVGGSAADIISMTIFWI